MQLNIETEKRSHKKQWSQRDKQIENIISSITGIYGALQGISGNSIKEVPALEFNSNS